MDLNSVFPWSLSGKSNFASPALKTLLDHSISLNVYSSLHLTKDEVAKYESWLKEYRDTEFSFQKYLFKMLKSLAILRVYIKKTRD